MENDVAERHTDTLLSSSDGIMTHPLEKKYTVGNLKALPVITNMSA